MAARVARTQGLRLFRFFLRKEARANLWPAVDVKALFSGPFGRFRVAYVEPE
jgi:hypothetical protein